jgi:type II secretory pathway component PulF
MALYSYEAFSKDGKRVKGIIDAPSLTSVKEQLAKQGLFPTTIAIATEDAQYNWFKRIFMRTVSVKEKILFTKQLAVLLRSGVPLLQAIELLSEQFEGRLHSILITVKDDIKGGASLANALQRYPKVFDNIYIQLVRAGEASGKLEVILDRLTEYLERREAVAKKISDAMRDPIMQMVIAGGVVVILLTKVVPQMSENFATMGKDLPGSTQFLVALSNFFINHYLLLILLVVSIVGLFSYWRSTASGKRHIDEIKLRLPIVSYLTKTSAVVQFCYTLGILIEGGVNLAEALDIVCNIIDNRVLADTLRAARDKIVRQGKISEYLKQTNIFPPIAIYLISTGEQSGQLDSMLLMVARNYEVELTEAVDSATAKIGPIMLVAMGLIVGFIVMAIATPIMKMNEIANLE